MSTMFSAKVLATKAQITLVLPRALSLKGEDKDGVHVVVRELSAISVCFKFNYYFLESNISLVG